MANLATRGSPDPGTLVSTPMTIATLPTSRLTRLGRSARTWHAAGRRGAHASQVIQDRQRRVREPDSPLIDGRADLLLRRNGLSRLYPLREALREQRSWRHHLGDD